MEVKDPVIKRFIGKMKHPAVITFVVMILIIVILGLIVDYIRPYPSDMIGIC